MPEIGSDIVANIITPAGEKPCRVLVKGIATNGHSIRIEMIDDASEVELPPGVQTIINHDRVKGD